MFNFNSFSIANLPKIEFGSGALSKVPEIVQFCGSNCLIVSGSNSFVNSQYWPVLEKQLTELAVSYQLCTITNEPSPELIDEIVNDHRDNKIDIVVAIGGGSAVDAGKAIAGLLNLNHSVMDFLEGVGPELDYPGPAVPFIAVPTTAGTGSEATKNAVLSRQAYDGFKKSFRDQKLVPDYAILDPDLLSSCPPGLIAANGMDALTQLMESYVSTRSNALTDALAIDGLKAVRASLLNWFNGDNSVHNRTQMIYASLLSGINLAQTGLGSVHGLASPLGAFFPIPHGVVCGTLVAEATAVNIKAIKEREPDNLALMKYAELGCLFADDNTLTDDKALEALVSYLNMLTTEMQLPGLKEYGVRAEQIDHVVANSRGSSMQTNPIVLTDDEIRSIVFKRLS